MSALSVVENEVNELRRQVCRLVSAHATLTSERDAEIERLRSKIEQDEIALCIRGHAIDGHLKSIDRLKNEVDDLRERYGLRIKYTAAEAEAGGEG